MSHALNRRHFLSTAGIAAAAIITPERALAGAAPAEWLLGVGDVEADIAAEPLRLIRGKMPAGFSGTLFRNGPAKFRRAGTASGHWFDGDGLIRRFAMRDGKAMLTARFVDTPKRRLETQAGKMIVPGFGTTAGAGVSLSGPDDTNPANTSLLLAGGELLALWEAGSPMRVDPQSLETKGFKTFRDDLRQMPFLAHPRVEPDGRIWNLGMNGGSAIVWQLAANGALEKASVIKLPRASYLHDFTATARHLVIVLQPWIQDSFQLPFVDGLTWRPELGTQVLVVDKDDLTKRRIFELPAFSFFHLGDAWTESDGTIRFDGCIERDPSFGQRAAKALIAGQYIASPKPVLAQFVLHAGGKAELLPTRTTAEFPSIDKRRAGLFRQHSVHVTGYDSAGPFPHGLGLWDWQRGRDDSFDFGKRQLVEEFLFVPRGAGERDGWLVGTTLNLVAKATELHILDAAHVSHGPIATWRASLAMPLGFHGTFQS